MSKPPYRFYMITVLQRHSDNIYMKEYLHIIQIMNMYPPRTFTKYYKDFWYIAMAHQR